MTLKQKVESDSRDSLKKKEELKLSTLRMLLSAIRNKEIEKRTKLSRRGEAADLAKISMLSDDEILDVIRTEVKKRRDSVESYKMGGREDLANKESEEIKILDEYLPQEVSDEEITAVVKEVISGLGEVSLKDFGRIMGEAMKKLKGKASGDRVLSAVKTTLNG